MINKKITELSAITTIADTDLLPIVDISVTETKKIPMSNMIYGQSIYGGTILTDLNTVNKNGFYTALGTATGVPSASYSWFIKHENSNNGTVSALQTATAFSTTLIKRYRVKQSSTWGAWIDQLGGTTPTEMTYLNGLTSNVQSKLNTLSTVNCIGSYRTTNQTLTANTFVTLLCNIVKFNNGISLNTSTGVYTVTNSGLYNLNIVLHVSNSATERRAFCEVIFTNGGTYCPTNIRSDDTQIVYGDPTINLNNTVFIQAGAKFIVRAYSTIASEIQGSTTYDNTATQVNIFKVAEYFS